MFNDELKKLKVHDHLCFIYHSPQEWQDFVIEYIRDGLALGQRCLYVFDTHTHRQIRNVLIKAGLPVVDAEASRQLILLHGSRVYFNNDLIDLDNAFSFWCDAAKQALADGFTALRLTSEMDWLQQDQHRSKLPLAYFGRMTQQFLSSFNCLAVGQYDCQLFEPEMIKNMLFLYPGLIHNYSVSYNNFELSTEQFASEKGIDSNPDFWMKQIEREDRLVREFHDTAHRLMALFTQTPTPILAVNENRKIMESNEAACNLLEIKREELLGKSMWQFVSPAFIQTLKQRLDVFTNFRNEECDILVQGRIKHLILNNVIIESAQGRLAYILAMDVTERKKLAVMALHLSAIVESSDTAVISVDFNGHIQSWNKKAIALLGYQKSEMIGRSVMPLFTPDFALNITELFEKLKTGDKLKKDSQCLTKTGEIRDVILRAFPIISTAGESEGISLVMAEKNSAE